MEEREINRQLILSTKRKDLYLICDNIVHDITKNNLNDKPDIVLILIQNILKELYRCRNNFKDVNFSDLIIYEEHLCIMHNIAITILEISEYDQQQTIDIIIECIRIMKTKKIITDINKYTVVDIFYRIVSLDLYSMEKLAIIIKK